MRLHHASSRVCELVAGSERADKESPRLSFPLASALHRGSVSLARGYLFDMYDEIKGAIETEKERGGEEG